MPRLLLFVAGLLFAQSPALVAQAGVPSTDAEWSALRSRVEANPYHLAALGKEPALAIVVAALRTRSDGVMWAALPGVCGVDGPDRLSLDGEPRQDAFRRAASCYELVLAELPVSPAPEVGMVRSVHAEGLAEALVESGNVAAADSVAAAQLAWAETADVRLRGDVVYRMNEVRGRVALRRGDRAAALEFLRRAATTDGSPRLNSFGPSFRLARELLEVGEFDAVAVFVRGVGRFWVGPLAAAEIAADLRTIEAGRIPDSARWR